MHFMVKSRYERRTNPHPSWAFFREGVRMVVYWSIAKNRNSLRVVHPLPPGFSVGPTIRVARHRTAPPRTMLHFPSLHRTSPLIVAPLHHHISSIQFFFCTGAMREPIYLTLIFVDTFQKHVSKVSWVATTVHPWDNTSELHSRDLDRFRLKACRGGGGLPRAPALYYM